MTIDYKNLGNKAFAAKDYPEAVKNFTKGIEEDPNNYILYSNRSAVYICLERYQDAYNDAIRCIELNPNWAKGYSRKGCAEYHLNKYEDAIESYKKALVIEPDNTTFKTALNQAEEALNPNYNMQNVIQELINNTLQKPKFKNYAEENPDYVKRLQDTLRNLYNDPQNLNSELAYNMDPKVQEGLKDILNISEPESESSRDTRFHSNNEKPVENSKESPAASSETKMTPEEIKAESLKIKGNELYKQKNFSEALSHYDKALELNPKNILYHTNKGAVFMEMGEYDSCISECQKAIDKRYDVQAPFEHVAKAYIRMAVCYRRQEKYDEAIEMYKKALIEDNNRHTRTALNETKSLKIKKDKEAYINPSIAEEHRLKGNEFFKNSQYPEAKKEYDEGIRRNPADSRLYANRAAALMKLLELPLAIQDVEKSLELNPKNSKVWARKGNIHIMMKEYNKALNAFMKGLEIDKDSPECCRGLNDVSQKIQESSTSDQVDEEQVKRAMADPEIQSILSDPQMAMILKNVSEDPTKLQSAMKDPRVAISIQKLMAAGILKLK